MGKNNLPLGVKIISWIFLIVGILILAYLVTIAIFEPSFFESSNGFIMPTLLIMGLGVLNIIASILLFKKKKSGRILALVCSVLIILQIAVTFNTPDAAWDLTATVRLIFGVWVIYYLGFKENIKEVFE